MSSGLRVRARRSLRRGARWRAEAAGAIRKNSSSGISTSQLSAILRTTVAISVHVSEEKPPSLGVR